MQLDACDRLRVASVQALCQTQDCRQGTNALALAPPREDDPSADDGVSRLPSVVLDPIGSGAVVFPLALRPPSIGVIVAIGVSVLIVIGVWLLF